MERKVEQPRRLTIPIGEHAGFKALFKRLGLETYVLANADNDGFVGGAKWQALGKMPGPWTAFKSAQEMTLANIELHRRNRLSLERAHENSDTLLCELVDVEVDDDGHARRKVFFGTEWSGSSVDADHFEAMSQTILAGDNDVHETRYVSSPRTIICLDEDGKLVGWCRCRRDAP